MSTSIHEQIERAEARARLLHIVAKRFPDVDMTSLWKDGPVVPVLTGSKHASLATDVMEHGGRLFAYLDVDDGKGETIAVFVCPGWAYGLDVCVALARLPEDARRGARQGRRRAHPLT
jgi:hypothetical protein